MRCSCAIPSYGARPGPTTRSAASGSCSARTSCPRSSGRTWNSSPSRRPGSPSDGIAPPTGSEREVDCVIFGTGFRTTEFMFPMEVTGSERPHAARGVGRRRPRPPGRHRSRLPFAVRDVRAEHEHLGRLDHPLRGDPGRLHPPGARARRATAGAAAIEVRAGGRGGERPGAPAAVRRDRLDAVRLLVPDRGRSGRRQLARLHARVRATCLRSAFDRAASYELVAALAGGAPESAPRLVGDDRRPGRADRGALRRARGRALRPRGDR